MTPPLAKGCTVPRLAVPVAEMRLPMKPEIRLPTGCSAALRARFENDSTISPRTLLSDLPSLTAERKALVSVRAMPSASVLIWRSSVETPPSSVEKPSVEKASAMRVLLVGKGSDQAVNGRAVGRAAAAAAPCAFDGGGELARGQAPELAC